MKCEKGTPQTAPERPRTDGTGTAHGKPSEAQEAPLSPLEAQERACPPACLKQERSKSVSGWCPCPLEAGGKRGSRAVPPPLWKRKDTPEAWGKRGGTPCLKQGRSTEDSPRRPLEQRANKEKQPPQRHPRKGDAGASNNGRTTENRPAEAPRKDGAKTLCRERAEGTAGHRSQSEAREMQASNPE